MGNAFINTLLEMRARWRERGGEGLRILTVNATTSPTLIRQLGQLAEQYPKMRWSRFEAVGLARRDEAMALAFGQVVTPHYRLDQSSVIVSLDSDLLGPGLHQVAHARDWATHRGDAAPDAGRSRLHVAESVPTLTGTVASSRLPADPPRIAAIAQAIGAAFEIEGFTRPELGADEGRWLGRAIDELRRHSGHSLLTIGDHLHPQIQALAPVVNDRLKNTGVTVWYSASVHLSGAEPEPLAALAAEIDAGAIDTLIMVDCNPVYSGPGTLNSSNGSRACRPGYTQASIPMKPHSGAIGICRYRTLWKAGVMVALSTEAR